MYFSSSKVVLKPNHTFLVRFGDTSGEFGGAMVGILARPNESDMPSKRTKMVRYVVAEERWSLTRGDRNWRFECTNLLLIEGRTREYWPDFGTKCTQYFPGYCKVLVPKYTAYGRFHANGPYGKIPTKIEPNRTHGLIWRLPLHTIK